jgi:V-type H+-transporting ATPase subunit a
LQICEAFAANRYPFPEDPARQRQMHGEVTARLRELQITNDAGRTHREAVLRNIAFNLEQWATQVSAALLYVSKQCMMVPCSFELADGCKYGWIHVPLRCYACSAWQ